MPGWSNFESVLTTSRSYNEEKCKDKLKEKAVSLAEQIGEPDKSNEIYKWLLKNIHIREQRY